MINNAKLKAIVFEENEPKITNYIVIAEFCCSCIVKLKSFPLKGKQQHLIYWVYLVANLLGVYSHITPPVM